MSTNTATTEKISGQIKRRITRSAQTHRQHLSDVMDSLTVDKKHAHLLPIIENVARRLVENGNQSRLRKAANDCVYMVERTLNETYWFDEHRSCGWFPLSDGPNCMYVDLEADEKGNILKEGSWVYESDDDYDRYSRPLSGAEVGFNADLIALQEAVKAANKSLVFQTAGVQLIVTDDLLVCGGMS